MTQLNEIAAHGTVRETPTRLDRTGRPRGHITCADGFTLSVQAGAGTTSWPRPDFYGTPADYDGPYSMAEVGYPSARPEPWADWEELVGDSSEPTQTYYRFVPIEQIAALIELHGGEKVSATTGG